MQITVPGLPDRKHPSTLTAIAKCPGSTGDLILRFEFPCVCRRIISLSSVIRTEQTGSSGIFTAGSEIIAFVMYRSCASVKIKALVPQRKTSAFCDQLFGEVQIVNASQIYAKRKKCTCRLNLRLCNGRLACSPYFASQRREHSLT
jgi:hypothetical protein